MSFFEVKKNKRFIRHRFSGARKNDAGFTLIETMVSISIMLITIVSPMVIAKQGLVSARQARNSITAFYLAQDAIEYIRNVRDSNILSGQGWLTYMDPCIDNNTYCVVDTLSGNFANAFTTCEVSGCPQIDKLLDINGDFDIYDYDYDSTATDSGFVRNVRIVTTGLFEEVRVEVTILWNNGGRVGSFSVSENLRKLVN